jgi:LL-diaminopimelate aminotransferase
VAPRRPAAAIIEENPVPQPAARLNRVPAYPFARINQVVRELNAQGHDVISLDVGSPDMPPPPQVIEALAVSANRAGKHGYSGYRGAPAFREAVARYYARRFGVQVDPERQVLPLLGSKEGIVNLAQAYLDHGDLALVPEIGYPSYALGTLLANGEIAYLPLDRTTYTPHLDALTPDLAQRAKLLWINYPNNPTGAVVDLPFYQQAVAFCRAHDILLASDNPYCDVTYDGYRAPSVLQAPGALDSAIEFISFSKTYNMAGWRLGAAVGSAEAIGNLLQVKSNVDSGHFNAIYDAGITAIDTVTDEWLAERNAIYARRRDCIVEALPHIGLAASHPKGSLYIWGEVLAPALDGDSYVQHALEHAHVSLAPGSMYGPGGAPYVRISLCTPDARLDEALARLSNWYSWYNSRS